MSFKCSPINHKCSRTLLISIILILFTSTGNACRNGKTSFEVITGYAYTSSSDLLHMIPGILELTECLTHCLNNDTCQAVNFETGLCVLLTQNIQNKPDSLKSSQFPVFTIYAQKICLSRYTARRCNRAWIYERVIGYRLKTVVRKTLTVRSQDACVDACIREMDFSCYSMNYNRLTNECEMMDTDRHRLNALSLGDTEIGLQPAPDVDFIENNCIEDNQKICEFTKVHGLILKTVDSIYPTIKHLDECKRKCLQAPYRCNSFDLGGDDGKGNTVCRTSHLSRAQTIHIQDPYLETSKGVTYELDSCYNVSLVCGAKEMKVSIKMNKPFSGKIYALKKPKTCYHHFLHKSSIEMSLAYKDEKCGIIETSQGHFSNSIVIQHHSLIVTSNDVGITINCHYDLSSRQVSHQFTMKEMGDFYGNQIVNKGPPIQEATITSPNVVMRVTDRNGHNIRSAQVGDELSLRFEVPDEANLYEIFVREVIADDGIDNAEYTLIDSNGCPTDGLIMGPIRKISNTTKSVEAHFEAFKFPTSGIVQFRAVVVPCLSACEPVNCQASTFDGGLKNVQSFGKRRRRRRRYTNENKTDDAMQFTQIIQITDKFEPSVQERKEQRKSNENQTINSRQMKSNQFNERFEFRTSCISFKSTMFVLVSIFSVQLILTIVWILIEINRKGSSQNKKKRFFMYNYSS